MRNGIEFHSQGFVDIMTCGAVDELCREHAMRIYAAASAEGGEFSVESKIVSRYTDRKYGGERIGWYVKAVDHEAIKNCAENKVLERAI